MCLPRKRKERKGREQRKTATPWLPDPPGYTLRKVRKSRKSQGEKAKDMVQEQCTSQSVIYNKIGADCPQGINQ